MKTTRTILTALVIASFLVLAVTGLVLAFPSRALPLLGISLLTWRRVHEWSALLFAVTVVAHVIVNRHRLVALYALRSAVPARAAVQPAADAPVDPLPRHASRAQAQRFTRRRFLLLAGAAVAGTVAVLAVEGIRPRRRSGTGPLADFVVLNVEHGPPSVSASDWVLTVDGLVTTPLRLDRSAWLALPRTEETRDFECVEGWGVKGLRWDGVRVADVLARAQPTSEGHFVTFHAYGATYTDSLPMDEATAPDTLLADRIDGGPLPAQHGGPLRLVIPSQLGYKNVKWVVRLEVTADRAEGYWERNGYPAEAPVR